MEQARTPGAKRAGPGEYLFDMHKVNRIMGGPGYSPVSGGCVEGERMIVALMRYPAGKPSDAHSHPNEQVLVVLSGRVRMTIGGESHELGPREVAHMPPNVPHSLQALEDTEVLSTKGIVGGVGHRI